MPKKNFQGGYESDAPWILRVVYHLPPMFDEKDMDGIDTYIDNRAGNSDQCRQSWGEIETNCMGSTRILRYSYPTQDLAMRMSRRIEKIKDVVSVDVYDGEYPDG